MNRVLRIAVMLALAAWLMGVDGCNGIGNVSVPGSQLDPSSPDAKQSSFESPVLVTRDNRAGGGR